MAGQTEKNDDGEQDINILQVSLLQLSMKSLCQLSNNKKTGDPITGHSCHRPVKILKIYFQNIFFPHTQRIPI